MRTFKQHKDLQKQELLIRLGGSKPKREKCVTCKSPIDHSHHWSVSFWMMRAKNDKRTYCKYDMDDFCAVECWLFKHEKPRKK